MRKTLGNVSYLPNHRVRQLLLTEQYKTGKKTNEIYIMETVLRLRNFQNNIIELLKQILCYIVLCHIVKINEEYNLNKAK